MQSVKGSELSSLQANVDCCVWTMEKARHPQTKQHHRNSQANNNITVNEEQKRERTMSWRFENWEGRQKMSGTLDFCTPNGIHAEAIGRGNDGEIDICIR